MGHEHQVSLVKLSFFFVQVKTIQVLVFDNWHPLKCMYVYLQIQVNGIDTRTCTTQALPAPFTSSNASMIAKANKNFIAAQLIVPHGLCYDYAFIHRILRNS